MSKKTLLTEIPKLAYLYKELREKTIILQNKYDGSTDMRVNIFQSLHSIGTPYIISLQLANREYEDLSSGFINGGKDFESRRRGLEDHVKFLTNGYIYNFAQLTEHFLRMVCKALGFTITHKSKFHEVKKSICNTFKISKYDGFNRALQILFNIRNAIHNNGYFLNEDHEDSFDYKGNNVEFVFKKQIDFSYDPFLSMISEDIINLFFYIIGTQQIINLEKIPKRY